MLHLVALSRCAVIVRHWFEIDLRDCALEHGARIELRELTPQVHRGSESAAQVVTLDRPLWRADVFDRVQGEEKPLGDVAIPISTGNVAQNVDLTTRQRFVGEMLD